MDVDQKPVPGFSGSHASRGANGGDRSVYVAHSDAIDRKLDVKSGIQASEGTINAMGGVETLALSQTHMSVHSEHQLLIEDLEIRKRANEIIIPTSDEHVMARLEEIGEPIIFFGETKPLRRQRLRLELARRGLTEGMPTAVREMGVVALDAEEAGPKRPFTTEGVPQLREARLAILRDSMLRSKNRLCSEQRIQNYYAKMTDSEWKEKVNSNESWFEPLASCLPSVSVVGDPRPLTSIAFNGTGTQLATTSWNPVCKIWNVATGTEIMSLKGHTERVVDIAFAPDSVVSQGSSVHLASSGTDKTIRLWNSERSEAVATLKGHDDRVNILAWHPSGGYLFASSHDCTWSMWDVATQTALLRQDGHSRAVFGLALHPDGAVLATGGVDAAVRLWDIRSGQSIHTFTGHVRQVLGVDWHPHGTLLASSSEDNTVRIWDLRTRKLVYTIPAHQGLVSDVKWAPHHGKYLVTSGYDSVARVWRSDNFSQLCTLSGHDSRVTALDISPAAPQSFISRLTDLQTPLTSDPDQDIPPVCIATAGYDRTWKLWSP
jgi:U4/U6 small nuclear ribonucleoprotein PRP4